ncbi:MAG: DUF6622 family protein, partial [Lautropia sp.]
IKHTPVWVFGLLAALIAYGVLQSRSRERSLLGAVSFGAALVGWSAYSSAALFPGAPLVAVAAWLAGAVAIQPLGRRLTSESVDDYDPVRRRLTVAGSWLPLALMMALFALRYVANVMLALQPGLAASTGFAAAMGLAWGLLGGIFVARLLDIVRFLRRFHATRAALA